MEKENPPSKKHHSKARNPFNYTLPQEVGKGHTSLFRSFQHPWQRASVMEMHFAAENRPLNRTRLSGTCFSGMNCGMPSATMINGLHNRPSSDATKIACQPPADQLKSSEFFFSWRICFSHPTSTFASNNFHESLQNMKCLHLHRWRQIHPRDHVVEAVANLGRCCLSDLKIGREMQPGNWP